MHSSPSLSISTLGWMGCFACAFHHHQSLFLTRWLSLCPFGDFQCEQQLEIGCCKADTRISTNRFSFWSLLSGGERGESAVTHYPAPESAQAIFFLLFVFFTAISWVVAEMQTESAPDRLKIIRNVSESLEQRFCYDNKECSLLVYYFKRRKLKRNISWRSWQCSKPTSCCYPWAWYYILLAAVRWTFPLGPFQALNPDPKGPSFPLLKGEREINLPADSAAGLLCLKNISTAKRRRKKKCRLRYF